jgi:hypothetical protein
MENLSSESSVNDQDPTANKLEALKEKVNVDQAAIDEARAAVGDDEAKIIEYLINNRGL